MRSKLIPSKRKYLEWEVIKIIAFIILVILLLYQSWQLALIRTAEPLKNTPTSAVIEPVAVAAEKTEQMYPLTDYERRLVESVVFAEAKGEGLIGMEAVSQVILDRVVLWNQTISEVINQPNQFATYEGTVSEECRLAVSNVFDLGVKPISGNVTHFYSGDVEPYWADSKESRGSVGAHKFFI